MNRFKHNLTKLLIFVLPAVIWSSCNHGHDHTGYAYFPDMAYSRAYETYTPNPNFADGETMRTPVEGTVPRGFEPFPYEKTDEDMIKAGKELKNPFGYSPDNVERGKLVFQRYCLQCHGEKGDGKGHLYTSGRYPYPPASLINDKMKKKPDGEMYHQILLGWGIMGAQGLLLRPEDRWKVILYIRQGLQHKNETNPEGVQQN